METTKYLVLFQAPKPKIVTVTHNAERGWAQTQEENRTTMYPSSTIAKEPNKLCDTEEEATAHLAKHEETWCRQNFKEIQAEELTELARAMQLQDGIYAPRKTPFVVFRSSLHRVIRNADDAKSLRKLIETYPNGCIANAYETETTIFFTEKIPKYSVNLIGEGFNYGSTNLLLNCPETLLILAEND